MYMEYTYIGIHTYSDIAYRYIGKKNRQIKIGLGQPYLSYAPKDIYMYIATQWQPSTTRQPEAEMADRPRLVAELRLQKPEIAADGESWKSEEEEFAQHWYTILG